jgi:hypothetical protein
MSKDRSNSRLPLSERARIDEIGSTADRAVARSDPGRWSRRSRFVSDREGSTLVDRQTGR